MGGGMMKRPMMKQGGKLKMVMKGGKKVPFFAADGKGAKDLGKAAMKKGGGAKGAKPITDPKVLEAIKLIKPPKGKNVLVKWVAE